MTPQKPDSATRNTTTATAHLPDVELGKHSSKWSMEVRVEKSKRGPLGTFRIAKSGIEFLPAHSKKHGRRVNWESLADIVSEMGYKVR